MTAPRSTDTLDATAQLRSLVGSRWSCRAFRSEPVAHAVVQEMFAIAQHTASWCNTQPWHTHVVSGEARDTLAAGLGAAARSRPQQSDLPAPERYTGVYQDRRRAAGFALYDSLGIERSDAEARAIQMGRNFEFFGAPHVAVVTTDRDQGTYGAIDCGGFIANLLNAATALGVATVPQAAIAMYADVVRDALCLPADRVVVAAVSFGYPDLEHPVNLFRTSRAEVSEAVTLVDTCSGRTS